MSVYLQELGESGSHCPAVEILYAGSLGFLHFVAVELLGEKP